MQYNQVSGEKKRVWNYLKLDWPLPFFFSLTVPYQLKSKGFAYFWVEIENNTDMTLSHLPCAHMIYYSTQNFSPLIRRQFKGWYVWASHATLFNSFYGTTIYICICIYWWHNYSLIYVHTCIFAYIILIKKLCRFL